MRTANGNPRASAVSEPASSSGDPSSNGSGRPDAACATLLGGHAPLVRRGPIPRRASKSRVKFLWLVLVILAAFAILLVGGEVVQHHYFPEVSVAWAHASLTMRAGLATFFACIVVYQVMRRQQQRLSVTADQLARLLESYQRSGSTNVRFENPHHIHCRDSVACDCTACPVHGDRSRRCWQYFALAATDGGEGPPRLDIETCHQCAVYQASCPDKLTELGESFNSLMFLLQEEKQRLDRLRGQMIEKEKMVALGQLASGIAHEVGNPLSSISSILQMVKRKPDSVPTSEQLDLMGTHVERISKTVRQMVTLARPRAEQWEAVEIRQVLEQVVGLVSFDRRARDVEIAFRCTESLPPTRAVPDELQQVFLNLAINALDAMPAGGCLDIQAERNSAHIVVHVRDTGHGIDAALDRRIFEPFFTTKEPGCGSGLGLSVSYGIIQKHGGTIDYESQPGAGTAFTVKLPILDA